MINERNGDDYNTQSGVVRHKLITRYWLLCLVIVCFRGETASDRKLLFNGRHEASVTHSI